MWEYVSGNELYHHGILGQKWGVRKGPPYPIEEGDHSALEKRKAAEARAKAKAKEKRREDKMNYKLKKLEQKKAEKDEKRIFTPRQKRIVALGAVAITGALLLRKKSQGKADSQYKKELSAFTKKYKLDDLKEDELDKLANRFQTRKKIIELGVGEGRKQTERGKSAVEGLLKKGLGSEIANDVVKKVATTALAGAALYGAKAFASRTFSPKEFGEAMFNGGPKKK